MKEALARLVLGEHLTELVMTAALESIMDGSATSAQIGAFLAALRVKGETPGEIAAAARVMRRHSRALAIEGPLMDTCGTGGDGAGTFNISTATALVLAAGGVRVAKHGNRAVSSRTGSADVLEALGVSLELTPAQAVLCLDEVGLVFLYAPSFHPALKHAAAARREIGFRSLFNLLGPLANPAGATHQLLGVFSPSLTEPVAETLRLLGTTAAMVVSGHRGVDELDASGPTRVSQLVDGRITTYDVTPRSAGLDSVDPESLAGGDAASNAALLRGLLARGEGPAATAVSLNAAAGFVVAGRVPDLMLGARLAHEILATGAALRTLDQLIEASRRLALIVG